MENARHGLVDPSALPVPAAQLATLTEDERRWLHDKYERLAAEESTLAANRTSYFAAIGTVLLTALVVAVNDFLNVHELLLAVVTFMAVLGLMISFVWSVLLHRTTDAQSMWRESARSLERLAPPLPGQLLVPITLRSGDKLQLDLLRPYTAHAERFSKDKGISWMDRVTPETLTEVLPTSFLVVWAGVLVVAWVYLGPVVLH